MRARHEYTCFDGKAFSRKCLVGVQFYNCSLRFCDFSQSDLSYAVFESCDLYCANFSRSVLYTARIYNCDATKADFNHAFMNGIRIRDTDITHTYFDHECCTGMVRKVQDTAAVRDSWIVTQIGSHISSAKLVERKFEGIYCTTSDIAIRFSSPEAARSRVWRRKSEVAKVIQRILEDNGYRDKALDFYFLHRRFLRKSMTNPGLKLLDYLFGELFWGYGVRLLHPVLAFFVIVAAFAIIYGALPLVAPGSGIAIEGKVVSIWDCTNGTSWANLARCVYGSFLISTLSVFGDVDVLGYGRVCAIWHLLLSILAMGLGITALTKKMSNI